MRPLERRHALEPRLDLRALRLGQLEPRELRTSDRPHTKLRFEVHALA